MNTPHKHAEVIKAWAEGVPCQVKTHLEHAVWEDLTPPGGSVYSPGFVYHFEYRIKPVPKSVKIYIYETEQGMVQVNQKPMSDFYLDMGWKLVKETDVEYEV